MNQEKDFLILTSLVAIGIVFISLMAVIFHSVTVLPLMIVAICIIPLILYQGSEKLSVFSEHLEHIAFIATFVVICVSIILLYRPL